MLDFVQHLGASCLLSVPSVLVFNISTYLQNNKSLTLLAEDLKDKEKMIVDLKEKLALFISSQKGYVPLYFLSSLTPGLKTDTVRSDFVIIQWVFF